MSSILTELEPRESKSETITYRVTPALKKALKEYAAEEGISLQDVLTSALQTYAKKHSEN